MPHDGGQVTWDRGPSIISMSAHVRPPQRRAREHKARALVAKIRRELKQKPADLRPLITAAKEKPLSEKKGAVIGRAAGEGYRPLEKLTTLTRTEKHAASDSQTRG